MLQGVVVGVGAVFGSLARYLFSNWMKKNGQSQFPWGTYLINMTGAFLLGIIIGSDLSVIWTLLLGTGFMGGFTTFSTLKSESVDLLLRKKHFLFLTYLSLSYCIGLLMAFAGLYIGNHI
ncbi:fluoride efflux transporter CrcB [Listeria monocytogenes]|uniref:Fluoride-specific ion channel FluC n=1 Tax=Listeria monocytogenes TaxID=1639 RepID=A0AAN3AYN0_LISMN|nr:MULTISPECIES: fluoride efflux transporter CrcB [Listeria]EAE3716053.1 fluoride efflux transporter CrcB [Listeria monocytogenes serotype 1/2c]MDA56893.1 fluoride efflux transporter CrcB [Listeria monocytogenes serotype 4b]AXB13897.1 fluoride efflux transporter CrcB [Listeria monocytogenes]EAA0139557.1 fluoride efflux transporter CrcB [Listeria monocytogenes]EAA0151481.1 fluoride efflux transporter CrcB [Listeria monocytogenes]